MTLSYMGQVKLVGEKRNSLWWVNLTEGDTYEDLVVDRRMILK
jgi:hypothetical protein